MSKVETACPHCRTWNTVEKSSASTTPRGYKIQCSHCLKYWEDSLGETGSLAKSAPSSELAALRVQVKAQLDELLTKINGLIESRAAAARAAGFNTKGREVEKSGVAEEELKKALADPVRFQPESSTGARFQTVHSIASGVRTAPGGRFVPDGFEKNDVAEEELKKSLNNPIRG